MRATEDRAELLFDATRQPTTLQKYTVSLEHATSILNKKLTRE